MMEKKITEKAMYESLIAFVATGEAAFDKDVYIDFCQKKIDSIEKKAARAKERAAEKKEAIDELANAVFDTLSDSEFETIADIAARIEGEEVTVMKVQNRLTKLHKANLIEKQQIEVGGGEAGKKRRLQGYRKIVQ